MADLVVRIRGRDQTGPAAKSAEQNLGRVRRSLRQGVANAARQASRAIAGVTVGLTALGALAINSGRNTAQLSRIAGVTAEEFQELEHVFRQVGTRADDVADLFREMQLRLSEANRLGTGPAVDALEILGLTLDEITALPVPEQLARIISRTSELEDRSLQLFVAEELLGGSFERAQGILQLTNDEFERHRREAHTTGQVLSNEAVTAAEDAAIEFDNFRNRLTILLSQGLTPVINAFRNLPEPVQIALATLGGTVAIGHVTGMTTALSGLIGVLTGPLGLVLAVGAVVALAGTIVWASIFEPDKLDDTLHTVVNAIGEVFGLPGGTIQRTLKDWAAAVEGVFNTVATYFTDTVVPFYVGIGTSVVEAFRSIGTYFTDTVVPFYIGIGNSIAGAFGDAWQAIRTGFGEVGNFFLSTIPQVFRGMANAVIGVVELLANGVILSINAIIGAWNSLGFSLPPVNLGPLGTFGGVNISTPDIPLIPRANIPRLQDGGIVTRPTLALIGEAGPEAVIPLGRGAGAGVTINVQGSIIMQQELERVIAGAVNRANTRRFGTV